MLLQIKKYLLQNIVSILGNFMIVPANIKMTGISYIKS